MENNNLDDNQIISLLGTAPAPDSEWVSSTRQKLQQLAAADVTAAAGSRTSRWNILFINISAVTQQRTFRLAGLAVLTFSVLAGGIAGYFTSHNAGVRPVSLSAEQQQQILAQIISHNAGNNIPSPVNSNPESQTLSTKTAGAADAASYSTALLPRTFTGGDNLNYHYSNTVYSIGPSMGKCLALGTGATSAQYANYDYNDGQGSYYYKSLNLDKDGQLITYSLSKNTSTGGEYYEYRGGQYAIKTVYKYDPVQTPATTDPSVERTIAPDVISNEPTNTSAPEPETSPDIIKQYFGENAQISATATEAGKEYYVVQYSFPTDCSQEMMLYKSSILAPQAANSGTTTNVVYVSWVNTQDFSVYKSFTYLDAIADANLVDSSVVTTVAKQTDFNDVGANFNFEYNVQVKTLDTSALNYTPEQQAQQTVDYLGTLDLAVLVPTQSGLKLTGIYANNPNPPTPAGWDYYKDRNYYPSGALGDQIFQDATAYLNTTSDYIPTVVSVSAYDETNGTSINLNAYPGTYTDDELIKTQYGDNYIATKSDITWTVNGQTVTAGLYAVTVKSQPVAIDRFSGTGGEASSSASIAPGDACAADGCAYTDKIVVVAYGNAKYLANVNGVDANGLTFQSYSSKNSSDLAALKAKILETLNSNLSVSGGEIKPL